MGNRGKGETPQELFAPRRLSFLPMESEGLERNGTGLCKHVNLENEHRVLQIVISFCPSLIEFF